MLPEKNIKALIESRRNKEFPQLRKKCILFLQHATPFSDKISSECLLWCQDTETDYSVYSLSFYTTSKHGYLHIFTYLVLYESSN